MAGRLQHAPPTGGDRAAILEQATAAMRDMDREDPGVEAFARKGYGYALFPEVAKGGLVFGGAYGRGVVYEQERFKEGPLDFAADATAVILTTDAAANARFVDGVAVIVRPLAGAMAEASVGAQQFKFIPK